MRTQPASFDDNPIKKILPNAAMFGAIIARYDTRLNA
jgi:hypothetical protein